MTAYMRHRSGRQSLELRREATAAGRTTCIEGGIANISHLNRLYDPVRATPPCAYVMGEHFLHEAHALLGEDALAAALLEIYRLSLARDSLLPGTEEEDIPGLSAQHPAWIERRRSAPCTGASTAKPTP